MRWKPDFTIPGMLIAALFFTASLTPSLVPRGAMVQGAVSGFSLAAAYAIGTLLRWLWLRMELPVLRDRALDMLQVTVAGICAVSVATALYFASDWQNNLRTLLEMPPVQSGRPLIIVLVAALVFLLLLWLGRLILMITTALARWLNRWLPGPQAMLAGVALTALLFWNVGNGVIIRNVLGAMDASYARFDALIEDDSPQPTGTLKTGGQDSLLSWEGLGRAGRAVVAAGPDRARIEQVTGGPAEEPLRIYVGLNSAPDPQARAELALAEMLRVGAFDRGTLVIATPTGTGWIDPESQRALEFLTRGDVATVAVQYSYLASWIALLVDPDYGVETARAVFSEVYGHWRSLPRETRPKLYLYGLSLGALNSSLSHDLFQVIENPYDGALWTGPPYESPTWIQVTRQRDAGSPAWLPVYRGGQTVRFMNQHGESEGADAPWGTFRILYLQYASDAVTFFDPYSAWNRPDWMDYPRGPDVSPGMTWIPVVTLLQLGVDMMTAVIPPLGYGHMYRFDHYVAAWAALTGAPGWDEEGLEELKQAGANG